jgi:Cu+-exporting ATPase
MKMAAAVAIGRTDTRDPVCGMTVDEQDMRAAGQFSNYEGRTYYFCNPGCKRSFDAEPAQFLKGLPQPGREAAELTAAAGHHQDRP